MSFAAVLGIALVIGTAVILGIALVSYMSSLARSAYELKVEMRKDLDDGIKRVEAEMIKQTKWARGDLMAEVERSRATMLEDLARRAEALRAALAAEALHREAAATAERAEISMTLTRIAERIGALEARTARLRLRDMTKEPEAAPAEPVALPPELPSFPEETANGSNGATTTSAVR
ncbi:hypothetical protein [Oleispirillum naphthae]|uniref:hypothetical protein n=1 Tax=Oleispirillum naphthae TaxID=2838853 RepID=UPI003082627D